MEVDFSKYNSPITMFQSSIDENINNIKKSINEQLDEFTLDTVHKVGIEVNKEELRKALEYDRTSFADGYTVGYNKATEEFTELFLDFFKSVRKIIDDPNLVSEIENLEARR